MMQRLVDHAIGVSKESVKTITCESLNNIVRIINGVSALLLALLPGNAKILEGIHGWELRPTFRGPRLPRWMENGASSFNQFIHELSVDSDNSSVEYSSSGEEDSDRYECPPSPASHSSRASEAAFARYNRHQMNWIQYILLWILLPVKLLLRIPLRLLQLAYFVVSKVLCISREKRPSHLHAYKRMQSIKEQFVHRATDRRRGIVEDLHLGTEICIEAVFDVVHKAAHLVLSPSKAFGALCGLFSSNESGIKEIRNPVVDASVSAATLGGEGPGSSERKINYESLNTDTRTCQDVITDLGYPYEAINVITADGYILLLERIPRRDARKALFLQHGVFDSSMGWVSNGVVGSPAFAAYDQGYDVYLGNFRGLVSREHVNKNISSRQYWQYSINEHGTEDIPAMIEKIHQVKTAELKLSKPDIEEETDDDQLYKLCAISHSLGGAAMIMYVVTRRIEEKPHRLSRLILLSPAGFHDDSNIVFSAAEILLTFMAPVMSHVVPAFYIPTRFFRMLVFKLARDLHNLPAVGGLVQTLMSYVVGAEIHHFSIRNVISKTPFSVFRPLLLLLEMKKFVSATNVKVSNNIPEDLVFSVLSKLPLKSLKRFGCVRKSWAFLFENLHFMTMYRNYFLSNNHSYYDGTSILLNLTNNPLPGEAFYDTLYILSGERFEIMVKLDWPPPFAEGDRFIDILSQTSVNGTLCLAKDWDPKCVFWNPTTDEFKVIPSSPFLSQLSQSRYVDHPIVYFNGFGYDRVRDDYKVIRWLSYYPITDVDEPWDEDLSLDNTGVDEPKEEYLDVDRMWEIYSLRSNSWRKLDIEMPCKHANEKLYMDGVCHWWSILNDINCYEVEPRLVSFDLCNEVCLTTPLPLDIVERYSLLHLTLLNGSIAFIIYDETTTFHIRILGELGVKESWVEVFVVEPLPGIERPIGAGKNGHIFFRKDDNEIVWFDLNTQMIEELGVKGNKYYGCQIIIYKDTLLPIGGL